MPKISNNGIKEARKQIELILLIVYVKFALRNMVYRLKDTWTKDMNIQGESVISFGICAQSNCV